jgi:hypothetical protein
MRFIVALAAVAALVSACTASTDPEPSDTTSSALGHCRVVCPKCHPGEVCPMYACIQDCSGPPAKCVENMMCPIGYTWSQHACSCVP